MKDEDLIRRSDAIKAVVSLHVLGNEQAIRKEYEKYSPSACVQFEETLVDVLNAIEAIPSADRPQGEWIEVKWHEITDEEREKEGYPKDWIIYMDCQMPADEERILIQTRWGTIELDEAQIDGEMYLDSGYSWVDDVVAWMPLPKPWKGADDE